MALNYGTESGSDRMLALNWLINAISVKFSKALAKSHKVASVCLVLTASLATTTFLLRT